MGQCVSCSPLTKVPLSLDFLLQRRLNPQHPEWYGIQAGKQHLLNGMSEPVGGPMDEQMAPSPTSDGAASPSASASRSTPQHWPLFLHLPAPCPLLSAFASASPIARRGPGQGARQLLLARGARCVAERQSLERDASPPHLQALARAPCIHGICQELQHPES